MDPFTIGVIIAQIGVSFYNQAKNKETALAIKAEQRKAKEEEIRNSQKRDMEKFLRSCELQERMELDAHKHKVKSIRQGFMNSFEKMIHKDNLDKHYSLNISPYIIQRSVIPGSEADIDNVRQELFCILTGSNDANFNTKVLPYIDESISSILSKFWNEASNHTICYYQNMWDINSKPFSGEDIDNLRVLIPTPTVAVTPLFSDCEKGTKLTIMVSVWGAGNGDALRQYELDPEIIFENLPKNYTKGERDFITERVTAYSVCAIGQITDVFYWTNFYLPPLLPNLLAKDTISIPENAKRGYIDIYSQIYNNLVLGSLPEDVGNSETLQLAKDIVEINQYNHPERIILFLRNVIALTNSSKLSSTLVEDSLFSFYKAKTDLENISIDNLDASLLNKEDLPIIVQLIDIAKQIEDRKLATEITDIIKRRIMSWVK